MPEEQQQAEPKESVAGTPADPTIRFTELKLNGKTYSLLYDFEAIAKAEDLTGLELLVGVNWRKINARRIRAMLYASMLQAHPDITMKEITGLLSLRNVPRIEQALAECWLDSSADPEPKANPPQPEPEPAKSE